jgi:hypothetical protein
METQQMMELLLARMNASMKEHNQDILAKMEANRKSDRQQMLAEISALQEDINSIQAEMTSATGAIKEMMNTNQAEMRSTVCAIWSELEETIQHEMKGVLLYVNQKMQNLRMELRETIKKNTNGITDSRAVHRQVDMGCQRRNNINHGGRYIS